MSAGLGWVVYLLVTTLDHPAQFIPGDRSWLVVATLFLTASMTTNIFVFHVFMSMQTDPPCKPSLSAQLFLTGQLLRYLPGRIWGIIYQVGVTQNKVPATQIVRVNIDMMVFMLIGNSLTAFLLLGHRLHWPSVPLVMTAICGILVLGILFSGGANWLIRLPVNRVPQKIGKLLRALSETRADPVALALALGFFALGWAFYVTAWNLLAKAYPVFLEVDFVALCAFYTLASIIGILSAITPAGLGVREAAFVVLASASADLEVLAFFAVFGRIWFLAVELGLLLIFLGFLVTKTGRE